MKEISIEKLMIGDWVHYHDTWLDKDVQASLSLFNESLNCEITPILLTDEILYNNKLDPMDIAWWDERDDDGALLGYCFTIRGFKFELEATFHYVHELQQAIRLAGLKQEVVI